MPNRHLEVPHHLDEAFTSSKDALEILVWYIQEGQRRSIRVVVYVLMYT
jgi:hypothetical protein